MPNAVASFSLPSGLQTILVAGASFVLALIVDGPHGGDAACAAIVVCGSVGPGGSSSLTGELGTAAHSARVWLIARLGQDSGVWRRNA